MKKIVLAFLLFLTSAACFAQSNFVVPSDIRGKYSTNIRSAPTHVQAKALVANVSKTFTLPAGTRLVVFSAECNFYAKPGASAAVPTVDVTDGSGSELNPAAWYFSVPIATTQQVSVVTASGACNVTAAAYLGPLS